MARKWQFDWAGPHGTAWGTFNALWSTISLSAITWATERWGDVPPTEAEEVAAVCTVVAVAVTFARAALTSKPKPALTVVYHTVCVAAAGAWITYTASLPQWQWWPQRAACIGVIVGGALVAGLLAGLASDPKPKKPKPERPDRPGQPVSEAKMEARAQAQRNARGDEWVELLASHGVTAEVENIEDWKAGNGHTVEVTVKDKGKDWRAVDRVLDGIAADLNLPWGCRIDAKMGIERRRALVDVMTRNMLAEDVEYPENRPVHSMRDPLQFGVNASGQLVGPCLREQCMLLAGEAGSGKSNAGHVIAAEIVTTNDGMLWMWDLTGKAWNAWLAVKTSRPVVDWCAGNPQELLFMSRAALRIGYARAAAYAQLMIDVDDDKLPISHALPEIVILGDEIARVTKAVSEFPEAQENLRLVTFEHRAVAIRAVFLALRGTDDVIRQSIQSQCQAKGVMRVTSRGEATWIVPGNAQFGPEDTPYPGCGGLVVASGAPIEKIKWRRMTPSAIASVARLVDQRGQQPFLDEPSRLAANGRNPDGSPMNDLLPGELDCYDTRWERFGLPAPATPPKASYGPATTLLHNAVVELGQLVEDARAHRAQQAAEVPADGGEEFERIMAAEGFGPDFVLDDEEEAEPETPETPEDEQVLLDILRGAGPQGMAPKVIRAMLCERGIVVSRDTLHARLNALKDAGKAWRPRYGHWAAR